MKLTKKTSSNENSSSSGRVSSNKSIAGSALNKKSLAKKTTPSNRQKLYVEFEKEEQELANDFADFNFETAWNQPKTPTQLALMEMAQEAAHMFFKKDARVNFRISQHDLNLLKHRANIEGLPYQTLLGSLVHKYVNNSI